MAITILYDTKTVILNVTGSGIQTIYTQESSEQQSGSGKTETINQFGIQEMSFEAVFNEAIYRDLIAWWSWARQGKAWSFDMTGAANSTTLDGAAAAGQKNVPLTSTSNFVAGSNCLLRAVDADDEFEIVVVGSVDTGVKIVAAENLKFTYASGDLFRHWDYWPSVISLDKKFNPQKRGRWYNHIFKFRENL